GGWGAVGTPGGVLGGCAAEDAGTEGHYAVTFLSLSSVPSPTSNPLRGVGLDWTGPEPLDPVGLIGIVQVGGVVVDWTPLDRVSEYRPRPGGPLDSMRLAARRAARA